MLTPFLTSTTEVGGGIFAVETSCSARPLPDNTTAQPSAVPQRRTFNTDLMESPGDRKSFIVSSTQREQCEETKSDNNRNVPSVRFIRRAVQSALDTFPAILARDMEAFFESKVQ